MISREVAEDIRLAVEAWEAIQHHPELTPTERFHRALNEHARSILFDICTAAARNGKIRLILSDIGTYLTPGRFMDALLPTPGIDVARLGIAIDSGTSPTRGLGYDTRTIEQAKEERGRNDRGGQGDDLLGRGDGGGR